MSVVIRIFNSADGGGLRAEFSGELLLCHSRLFAQADRQLSLKPAIRVLNKCDLPRKLMLPSDFPGEELIPVSATRGDGIEQLRDRIAALAGTTPQAKSEMDCFVNERQADVLRRCIKSLTEAAQRLANGESAEFVSQELRIGLDAVGEVTGKTTTDDILDRIFSQFCIGK